MLCRCGAVLDGIRQSGVVLFQKQASDIYLPEDVDFFVRNSSFGRRHSLPVLLTSTTGPASSECERIVETVSLRSTVSRDGASTG